MSYKQGQDTNFNYTDGVRVKISEKYKPPPRINLAMTYSQRLSLNRQIQENMPNYDFTLEHKIRENLKDYKLVKQINLDERKERLDKIKDARKKFKEEDSKTDSKKVITSTSNYSNYISNSNVLIPTQAASTTAHNILIPATHKNANSNNSKEKSPFNISEFEADTSSPFDNMELKTINDMEELALVLQNDENIQKKFSCQTYTNYDGSSSQLYTNSYVSPESTYSFNLPSINNPVSTSSTYVPSNIYNKTNGYLYDPYSNQSNFKVPFTYASSTDGTSKSTKTTFKTVPDIMKALQTELDNTHINHTKSYSAIPRNYHNRYEDQTESDKKTKELENPYETLSKELQCLSRNISSMGFPLDRVARACKVLGNDHKKVCFSHILSVESSLIYLHFRLWNIC